MRKYLRYLAWIVLLAILVLAAIPDFPEGFDDIDSAHFGPFFSVHTSCPIWNGTSMDALYDELPAEYRGYWSLLGYVEIGDGCDRSSVLENSEITLLLGWRPLSNNSLGLEVRLSRPHYWRSGLFTGYIGNVLVLEVHEDYRGTGETTAVIDWVDNPFCQYYMVRGCQFDLRTMRWGGAGEPTEDLCPKDSCYPQ